MSAGSNSATPGQDRSSGASHDRTRGCRALRAGPPHGGSGGLDLGQAVGVGTRPCGAHRDVVVRVGGEEEWLAALLAAVGWFAV
jgi:hypothetical protein